MGQRELPFHSILTAPKQLLKEFLKNPDGDNIKGRVIIRADTVSNSNFEMSAIVAGSLIPKKRSKWTFGCCYGKPDNPYFLIQRGVEIEDEKDARWLNVFETEVLEGTVYPTFKKIKIKLSKLNLNDNKMPLKFTFVSFIGDETRDEYGSAVLSIDDI